MSATAKKLYIVHVGYYDAETNYNVYESHTNFFVAATSPQEAKKIVKAMPIYEAKKMHTDGVQEIQAVSGHHVRLEEDAALVGATQVRSYSYNDLNPAAPIGGTSN